MLKVHTTKLNNRVKFESSDTDFKSMQIEHSIKRKQSPLLLSVTETQIHIQPSVAKQNTMVVLGILEHVPHRDSNWTSPIVVFRKPD